MIVDEAKTVICKLVQAELDFVFTKPSRLSVFTGQAGLGIKENIHFNIGNMEYLVHKSLRVLTRCQSLYEAS